MTMKYAVVIAVVAVCMVAGSRGAVYATEGVIDLVPVVETDPIISAKVDALIDEYSVIVETFEADVKKTTNQTIILPAYADFTQAVQDWAARWKEISGQVSADDLSRVKIKLNLLNSRAKALISQGAK